ncbi:extracellular solute-binding protein family 5 [Halovivax asiaticus JCM 14624]|uniref:Extracellular solute-binding protein family 5 n=1 Tax=Halovivax asiaticus JCM 14624 TaxID=1227490 RepID=M0BSD2_9EURY|nr:ABC transporter substrate-binding protein [Halovivax asiaticus]ELZ12589.1 extracellular solute-binding protein family 5 [Halovivax asiaticus JCM 14624]
MTGTGPHSSGRRSRRAFLATVGTGVTLSTSGCTELFTEVASWGDQLSVTITTVPDDDDRQSNGIFKHLASSLRAAGIDVTPDLRTTAQFEKKVLIDQDFDIFVGRYPGTPRPDGLYELFHSTFAYEPGWQNPYGVTNIDLDERLEQLRHATGTDRTTAIESVFDSFLATKPFVPVCAPAAYYAVNDEEFTGWDRQSFRTRLGYVDLDPAADVDQFDGLVTDARPTQNLNPLATHYRHTGAITSLLYDSLATQSGDGLSPWMARDWEWQDGRLTATMRPDLTCHDGEPLTAEDVAFTFEFLTDLSLGRADSPVPAPRFRRETSAVTSATALDDQTVECTVDASREVATSVLTVPILPEHVWRPLVDELDEETASTATWLREELMAESLSHVGSGPYQFESWVQGDQLTLGRFDEHFSVEDPDLPGVPVESLVLRNASNGSVAIEMVDAGDASALVTPIEADVIGETQEMETATRITDPGWAYYQIGFNTQKHPFSNHRFRRAVASLIDRQWLAETVFHGHAQPLSVPKVDTSAMDDYAWEGADPETPFVGTDGEVDVEAARDLFREASFEYNDSDELVVGN